MLPQNNISKCVDISKITTLDQIKAGLESLTEEEEQVNDELRRLLNTKPDEKMTSIKNMLPSLHSINSDAEHLAGMIGFTSTLAENISSKVRQLDLAKSRVIECMQRVEDVWDLKFCTDGVQTALQDEDYEKAAGHIHRFLSMDENIVRMQGISREGDTLETSFKRLRDAQKRLQTIVHKQFNIAAISDDSASAERFFKIFPLISQHKEGMELFAKYLSTKIREVSAHNLQKALSNVSTQNRVSVIFADTLTLLFEQVARQIEIHQPLVETYYGPGYLIILIEHLQHECDKQSRLILDEFKRHRNLHEKCTIIQDALRNPHIKFDRFDAKELDIILAEVTLLNARSELYNRFIKRRIVVDLQSLKEVGSTDTRDLSSIIANFELSALMQELIGGYIMIEEHFMREMVTKAVKLDTYDTGSMTSSMIDDVFFIIKKCIRRALSSSSIDGVCAMLNHACDLLEHELTSELTERLKNAASGLKSSAQFDFSRTAYRSSAALVSMAEAVGVTSSVTGSSAADDKAKPAVNYKQVFVTTLNNTDMCSEYTETLAKSLKSDVDKMFSDQLNEKDSAKLESCLHDLTLISKRFSDVLDFGFKQLSTSVIGPTLKPSIVAFSSVDHNIDEDTFASYEANDPWCQELIVNVDSLLNQYKVLLTDKNFDTFNQKLCIDVSSRLEKSVLKTSFNRLGGMQFDRELRTLIGYLSSASNWSIRDRFARLNQISLAVNLESKASDILDYWGVNSGSLTWWLTPVEVKQALSLRVEFSSEEIQSLKL